MFCGGGFMLREGGFMLSAVDSCFAMVGWVSGILLCGSGWWWLGSRGCVDIVVMGFLVGGLIGLWDCCCCCWIVYRSTDFNC